MKTTLTQSNRRRAGFALLITLIFVALAAVMLMALMNWTSQSNRMADRNNEYTTSLAAAEAASEMALVHLSRDYIQSGQSGVQNNLAGYQTLQPLASHNAYWSNYTFINPSSKNGGVFIAQATNWQFKIMDGQYHDLYGYQSTYQIVANAQLNNSRNGVMAAVQQDIGLEAIPIFQFAVFYNMDMEMNPSPAMVVTGRVHANGNIYSVPSTSLDFQSDVTASGFITNVCKPGDPLGDRGTAYPPNVNFHAEHDDHTSTLNLPIGTNGTSQNVSQILQVPPAGESATSPMGSCRLYNKADLLVLITDSATNVTSGVTTGTNIAISSTNWSKFLDPANIIYNKRESSPVRATVVDVAQLKAWAEATNNPITPLLSSKTCLNVIYICDSRSPNMTNITVTSSGRGGTKITNITVTPVEPAVQLINGGQLPKAGLSVITPDPVYVTGDYNVTCDGVHFSRGSNDTTYTLPAAVMGDAIMVLSTAWDDANAGLSLDNRVAGNTTINAAFLSGIVPTGNDHYSGGVENFPRFLEDWGGKTFCYNGSMVVMFNSAIATAPWGSNSDTYSPPTRQWAFDKNFQTESKLPPATPQILFIERLGWQSRKPGTIP